MPRTKVEGQDLIDAQVAKAQSPTETFVEYSAWLKEKAGVTITPRVAQISSRLYGQFQQENRDNGGSRVKSNTGTVAPKAKAAKTPATKSDGEASTDPGEETTKAKPAAKRGAKPAPVRGNAKATAKPAAAKPSAPRSGRRGKVADAVEAPY